MKDFIYLGIITILICTCFLVHKAWATASEETGDTRAVPVSIYGTQADGTLTAFLVDSNGVLQVTS